MRGLLLLAIACTTAGALAQTPSGDDDYLQARSHFARGERFRLDALAPRLEGHPLQAYVAYWRLKLGLDTAGDDEVRAFLVRWDGTALADRLRIDWLKVLARRGDWETFAAEQGTVAQTEDVELACDLAQSRRQREGDAALESVRTLWFTGQNTPDVCEPLFDAMFAQRTLTVADRRARVRLAVEGNNLRLAAALSAPLPPDERVTARELAAVDRDPQRAIAKGAFAWKHVSGRELALVALERAARKDAAEARIGWEKIRSRLPDADRHYGNARLAYHAARQLVPRANEWFREAPGVALAPDVQAWRVRAALRAQAWDDVLSAIVAMSPSQAQEPAWRYWKARALAAQGRASDARALFEGLADDQTFYAVLAAEALGQGRERLRGPLVCLRSPTPEAMAAFAARPEVVRALKLLDLDQRPDALREWHYAVRRLDDEGLLAAAEFARQRGLYDRAINTAERTLVVHDFALRYLTPYREQFTAASRATEVDEALLFGLARQESRFNAGIVSSAGAIGLMQLMPFTARWVAKQVGRADWQPSDVADVTTNTHFGAFYFKYWLDRLERLPALAAAAYNAGPGRAQAWRAAAPLEGAIWVETIPYNETRDYVKKVLANTMYYARELGEPYVALTTRLGTVPPRGAAVAAAGGSTLR